MMHNASFTLMVMIEIFMKIDMVMMMLVLKIRKSIYAHPLLNCMVLRNILCLTKVTKLIILKTEQPILEKFTKIRALSA